MKLIQRVLCVCMLAAMSSANAVDDPVVGEGGAVTCAQWVSAREWAYKNVRVSEVEQQVYPWMQGYLAAINLLSKEGPRVLVPDTDVIAGFVDTTCKWDPKSEITKIAAQFAFKMQLPPDRTKAK